MYFVIIIIFNITLFRFLKDDKSLDIFFLLQHELLSIQSEVNALASVFNRSINEPLVSNRSGRPVYLFDLFIYYFLIF